jgi:carboxylesterase type B
MFPLLARFLLTDEDRAMTQIMHQCWMSFVKAGKPECPDAPAWPRYRRQSDRLMELNLQPRVLEGFRAAQLDAQEAHKDHYLDQVRASVQRLLEEGIGVDYR